MDASTIKKSIIYICIAALLFGAGYFFGCGSVHDDRAGNDPAGGYIQSAQDEAEAAGNALDRADSANRDATATAGDIAEGNRDIEAVNRSIAELIEHGERILADIRSRGETGTR